MIAKFEANRSSINFKMIFMISKISSRYYAISMMIKMRRFSISKIESQIRISFIV